MWMGLYTQRISIGSFPLLIILVETSLNRFLRENYQSIRLQHIIYMSRSHPQSIDWGQLRLISRPPGEKPDL